MLRFIAYGWIDAWFVEPKFHFKYWGWRWVEPLPPAAMHGLFWALCVLGLAVAAGFLFRAATLAFVLGFVYLQLVDVTTYLNHYYLAALLGALLAVSPAHAAGSVDAHVLRLVRPRAAVPTFWLWLFRFQVGIVYTFAGLAKANADWLLHAQPLRIWLASRTSLPVLGPLFTVAHAPLAMSWAGFLFDTFILWFLLVRRVRLWAFALLVLFHGATSYLFPIGMFPVIMVTSALVFFPPDWPRALLAKLGVGERRAAPPRRDAPPSRATPVPRAAFALAGLYAVLQLALPLRSALYGGDVRWHEQGMRFSWRVMVREKNGSVTFVVSSASAGRTWHVSPRAWLTPLQEREMSGQPDLILQLAHRIREDFEQRGHLDVAVRADALVSLNGRRLARLVDPSVDLSRVPDGLAKATWVLPSPREAPPAIQPL